MQAWPDWLQLAGSSLLLHGWVRKHCRHNEGTPKTDSEQKYSRKDSRTASHHCMTLLKAAYRGLLWLNNLAMTRNASDIASAYHHSMTFSI